MRIPIITVLLLAGLVLGRGWAAEKTSSTSAPVFSLAPAESETGAAKFSEAQLAYVQSWIRQKAPECPAAQSAAVAEQFLEELQQARPGQIERLLSPDFPSAAFESMLLRQVALKLTGAAQTAQREELARRRVSATLTAWGREAQVALTEAAPLIAKIRDSSSSQYRRLVEGKMDEDDLELVLKRTSQTGAAPKETAPAKPKVLTATDIVAEFFRHNQVGSAVQRLQAYTVEGKLKTATGEEQDLLLFKMRPDRFRLVVRTGGTTRYILAGDGTHFWQQVPGQPTRLLNLEDLGQRIYLAEFADPLFVGEGYSFERLTDEVTNGTKIYRIAVERPDGSKYIVWIDQEKFTEIGRENEDHSVAHYSNFRDIGGVTYAFREEVVDAGGKKGVFEVGRITPNPGLIQEFFELPMQKNEGYFEIERLLSQAGQPKGNSYR